MVAHLTEGPRARDQTKSGEFVTPRFVIICRKLLNNPNKIQKWTRIQSRSKTFPFNGARFIRMSSTEEMYDGLITFKLENSLVKRSLSSSLLPSFKISPDAKLFYKKEFESQKMTQCRRNTCQSINLSIKQSTLNLFIHVAPKSELDQNANVYGINRQIKKPLFCFHFCRRVRKDPKPLGKNNVPRGAAQLPIIKSQVWHDANFVPTLSYRQWISTDRAELLTV